MPNGELPAIRCLWSETASGKGGQLDVQVRISNGMVLEECFAGVGSGLDALHDGFQNFIINSLYVLLAAFWHVVDDEQVTIEEWELQSQRYQAFIGRLGTRASGSEHPGVPKELLSQLKTAIGAEKLTRQYHWIMNFFCHLGGQKKNICQSMLDNQSWAAGEQVLQTLPWHSSESYYSVRHFMVLKKITD